MVLEPGGAERILTAAETLVWLRAQLEAMAEPPADLRSLGGGELRARRLLETACELETSPGFTIRWFAVRLEPPGLPGGQGC